MDRQTKLIIGICFFVITSCQSEVKPKEGVLLETSQHGNIISRIPYYITKNNDTVINGTVVHYYEKGNIEDSFSMKDGLKQGFSFLYDSNGTLLSKRTYMDGKKSGLSFSYFTDGSVSVEGLFRNDTALYTKNFHTNGRLKSYFIMKDNVESCYYLIKDSIGNILENSGDSLSCKKW